jgi:hypothetical protein
VRSDEWNRKPVTTRVLRTPGKPKALLRGE